jgi:transcriptional regulator with XRE-family HTH domain
MRDASLKSGISSGNISGFETGRYLPSAKALVLLSKIYNVTTDWILKGEEKSESILKSYLGEQDDPILREMIEYLKTTWSNGEKMRHWLEIQFQQCFPKYKDKCKEQEINNKGL